MKTPEATTVVQPFPAQTADWVTLTERTISLENLKTCSFSSQLAFSSNSNPSVDASIDAAMSSAKSPANSSVSP
jgi:hypothetical protein